MVKFNINEKKQTAKENFKTVQFDINEEEQTAKEKKQTAKENFKTFMKLAMQSANNDLNEVEKIETIVEALKYPDVIIGKLKKDLKSILKAHQELVDVLINRAKELDKSSSKEDRLTAFSIYVCIANATIDTYDLMNKSQLSANEKLEKLLDYSNTIRSEVEQYTELIELDNLENVDSILNNHYFHKDWPSHGRNGNHDYLKKLCNKIEDADRVEVMLNYIAYNYISGSHSGSLKPIIELNSKQKKEVLVNLMLENADLMLEDTHVKITLDFMKAYEMVYESMPFKDLPIRDNDYKYLEDEYKVMFTLHHINSLENLRGYAPIVELNSEQKNEVLANLMQQTLGENSSKNTQPNLSKVKETLDFMKAYEMGYESMPFKDLPIRDNDYKYLEDEYKVMFTLHHINSLENLRGYAPIVELNSEQKNEVLANLMQQSLGENNNNKITLQTLAFMKACKIYSFDGAKSIFIKKYGKNQGVDNYKKLEKKYNISSSLYKNSKIIVYLCWLVLLVLDIFFTGGLAHLIIPNWLLISNGVLAFIASVGSYFAFIYPKNCIDTQLKTAKISNLTPNMDNATVQSSAIKKPTQTIEDIEQKKIKAIKAIKKAKDDKRALEIAREFLEGIRDEFSMVEIFSPDSTPNEQIMDIKRILLKDRETLTARHDGKSDAEDDVKTILIQYVELKGSEEVESVNLDQNSHHTI